LVQITKMWANLVLFIFNLFTFQKYQGHISLGNCEKPVPFPTIEVLLMQKNLRLLFSVGGSVYSF